MNTATAAAVAPAAHPVPAPDTPTATAPDTATAPAPGTRPGPLSATEIPAAADLAYAATVDRRYVHREAVAEVFVTDSVDLGDRYLVAAQLPRGHVMTEASPWYDFGLLVEAVRQAGVCVSHRHLDLPFDLNFLFRNLDIAVLDIAALRVGARPARLVIESRLAVARTIGGRATGVEFTGQVSVDGRPAATGQGSLMVMTAGEWRSLRAAGRREVQRVGTPVDLRPVPAPAPAVGRSDARNVVVGAPVPTGPRTSEAPLRVDPSHPYLFDHPLDHVPGNLLLEAARQAATAALALHHGLAPTSLAVLSCRGDFTAFVELDVPTRLVTTTGEFTRDGAAVTCTTTTEIQHAGRSAARIVLTLGVVA